MGRIRLDSNCLDPLSHFLPVFFLHYYKLSSWLSSETFDSFCFAHLLSRRVAVVTSGPVFLPSLVGKPHPWRSSVIGYQESRCPADVSKSFCTVQCQRRWSWDFPWKSRGTVALTPVSVLRSWFRPRLGHLSAEVTLFSLCSWCRPWVDHLCALVSSRVKLRFQC